MPSRAHLALLRRLRRPDVRRAEGRFVVEGRRVVEEALDSGAPVTEVLVTDRFAGTPAGRALLARTGDVAKVDEIRERDLLLIADTKTPQGVLAVVERREVDRAILEAPGLFLVLDGVSDPGNVGTLVRAADAFGAVAVVVGNGAADPENPKVLRAAMGSNFHLPVSASPDLPSDLTTLREAGNRVLAAALDGEDAFAIGDPAPGTALVLGNEARGISSGIRAVSDRVVTVPCPGRAESLNVEMAGAILLSRFATVSGGTG